MQQILQSGCVSVAVIWQDMSKLIGRLRCWPFFLRVLAYALDERRTSGSVSDTACNSIRQEFKCSGQIGVYEITALFLY